MSDYIVVHGIRICKNYENFVPETFGRLTTIGPRFVMPVGKTGKRCSSQVCMCECGNVICTKTNSLRTGDAKSCGCLQKEAAAETGRQNATHRLCFSAEYAVRAGMISRCTNPNVKSYPNYGGRGITVCDRWLCPVNGFLNFLDDMGPRPSPKHEIERKDVNGNYCPENCEWVTRKHQARNKRNSRMLTYNGKTQCLAAWAEECGIGSSTITKRLRLGWTVEAAITTPLTRQNLRVLPS